jgi:hypothetical protein
MIALWILAIALGLLALQLTLYLWDFLVDRGAIPAEW